MSLAEMNKLSADEKREVLQEIRDRAKIDGCDERTAMIEKTFDAAADMTQAALTRAAGLAIEVPPLAAGIAVASVAIPASLKDVGQKAAAWNQHRHDQNLADELVKEKLKSKTGPAPK